MDTAQVLPESAGRKRPARSPLRALAAALIVAAGASVVLGIYASVLTNRDAADRDFISYWAAEQLLVHGQNPYDFELVKKLEVNAGRSPQEPLLMMRNLPVGLIFALPLGFAGPKVALIVWLAILLAVLSVCIWMLWRLNGKPDSRIHLLGYAFAPVLVCLMAGQFGILMLFGLTIFLYLHRTRPFVAGAFLSLLALKPHYFLPFGAALLLWSVTTKNLRVIAGFCAAIAVLCAGVYLMDPIAWAQYSHMMRTGGALNEVIPELSAYLRLSIDPRASWIQFVPQTAACMWAAWYLWTRRAQWSWMEQGLVVLLVGAVCTPFGWLFDESVLLPAILFGLYRAIEAGRPAWPIFLLGGGALVESLAGVPVVSAYFLWTTPAWFFWYLYATGRLPGQPETAAA